MKLGDFLNSGFVIEGWKKLQAWVDDKPKLIAEGYRLENVGEYLEWEVAYVFPCVKSIDEPAICIELVEAE